MLSLISLICLVSYITYNLPLYLLFNVVLKSTIILFIASSYTIPQIHKYWRLVDICYIALLLLILASLILLKSSSDYVESKIIGTTYKSKNYTNLSI
jgi:hypothetical protein